MILYIGNKRYSSWSLRPWALLRHFEIPFTEKLIPLDTPETRAAILAVSPSGRVPALVDGDVTVWESLAIAEYLNERFPEKKMWPADPAARARARSISNEMHAGFSTMRELLPHDLRKRLTDFDWTPARQDIDRVKAIWKECLDLSGGPYLFGEFSIADAMYLPVVNRFVTYGVPAEGKAGNYVRTMRELPAFLEWLDGADKETLRMPRYE